MIKLASLLISEQNATPGQGNFYNWTRDFDAFKTTINAATESAKNRFEKTLLAKLQNRSVLVRASKAQPKQPVKDYTINRVMAVNLMIYTDEWTVVLKDEFNKEFCLQPGFKIKVMGKAVAQEPGSANTPQEPEPAPEKPVEPAPAPVPTKPVANQQKPAIANNKQLPVRK